MHLCGQARRERTALRAVGWRGQLPPSPAAKDELRAGYSRPAQVTSLRTKATGSLLFLPSGFARVPIRLALRGPQNVHSATHGMQTPSRQGFHLRLCRAIGPPCVSRPAERVFCGARNAPISQLAFYLPKGSIPFGRTSSFLPRTPTEDEVAAFSAQGTPLDSKTGCGTAQVGSRPGHGA